MPTPLLQINLLSKLFLKMSLLTLKVFGCLCWPCIRPYNKNTSSIFAQCRVFLGYGQSHKGYICRVLESDRIYITGNSVFDEVTFPFYRHSSSSHSVYSLPVYLSIKKFFFPQTETRIMSPTPTFTSS